MIWLDQGSPVFTSILWLTFNEVAYAPSSVSGVEIYGGHNEEEKALDLYHWVSAAAAPIPSNQFSADLPVCAVQVYTVHSTANTTE